MAYAAAVNDEIRDLFAAGADIVQIDEPWLQSRADKAREFALPAIDRALAGVGGTTALHTCFGYAHVVHDRPPGYPFLDELAGCAADILAIEAAQPKLDPVGARADRRQDRRRRRARPVRRRAGRDARGGRRADRGGTDRDPARAPAGRPRLRDEVPAARRRRSRSCARSSRARGWRASGSSSRANCGWVGRRGSISSQSPRRARSVLRNSPIASTSSHGRTVGGRLLRNAPWPPYPAAVTNSRSGRAYAPARAPRAARRSARRCR